MATLNDYKVWFEELDLESFEYEAARQLVHSLRNTCECGLFNTQIAKGTNNGWIISSNGIDDKLHLKTPKQVSSFITYIELTFCEGMDAEIYASYRHNLEKDN